MAISMDALLKIKADVQGEGAVQGLASKLGAVQGAAAKAQGGFKGLAGAAGGLVGGLQTLMPLATGAGLVAMGKGAIDAADDMNDLAQKTGISVERLSQIKQAAEKSGTSLDAAGGAMIKLNKGLAEGVNSNAGEALKSLGINANDASGKLKTTDQIMLEVADKFKAMPDGAQKSALAMQLFGKSGADLIPMLNGGSESIKNLAVTMTGEFASGADEFNDKMVDLQTGMTKLGVSIGTALLPVIGTLTDGLVVLVNGFNTLPGPIQTVIGGLALLVIAWGPVTGAIGAVVTIVSTLGPLFTGVAATIAGWAGAIGPAIATISAAFSGFLAFLTGTILPGLLAFFSGPVGWTVLAIAAVVAMAIAFREPLMNFISWLWEWGKPIREFWIGLWEGLKGAIVAYFEWASGIFQAAFQTLYAITWQLWVQPWINLWENLLRAPVTAAWSWLQSIWGKISGWFTQHVTDPITKAWEAVMTFLPKAMENVVKFVQGIWTGMIDGIKNAFRGMLQYIANAINTVTGLVNRVISGFNALPGPYDIQLIPTVTVPALAAGGVIDHPTLAMVGEGGEREYVIPESKMAAASARYLTGARGAAVVPGGGGGINIGSPQINVTTGPVLQQDGQQYVTVRDLERAMRMTAEGVIGRLRTPAARTALGLG